MGRIKKNKGLWEILLKMSVWSGKRVATFVEQPPTIKINPNGVDIKVAEVFLLDESTVSLFNGNQRTTIPEKILLKPDTDGFYDLPKGVYEIRLANKITIPKNAVALFFPRSTLNRLGLIKSHTAIGDSGYVGYPTQTIFVPIKNFRIYKEE